MKSPPTSHGFQRPSNAGHIKDAPDEFRIPRPNLELQTLRNTTQQTDTTKQTDTAPQTTHAESDDEGWGSDFDDVTWTKEEQDYFDARFDWEDRKMAGVEREPPPVPPRSWAK